MGKWVTIPHVEIDPDIILRVDEQLARTFQCAVHVMAFFEDFQDAYTDSRSIKVPIDEWRRFIEVVIKTEKEKIEIRQKRLLGIGKPM
jgi:hypothetical protein